VQKTAGAGIHVYGPQHLTRIENVHIDAQHCGIRITNGGYWVIRDCAINRSEGVGIHVTNTSNPDEGDSVITGNLIQGGPSGIGLVIESSGHKVTSNKFLGHNIGMVVQPYSSTVPMCDILFMLNSIENQTTYGTLWQTPVLGSGICNSHCANNQYSGQSMNGAALAISGNVHGVVVTGNQITANQAWGILVCSDGLNTPGQILRVNNLVTGTPLEGLS
jgi:hypothetical protein